MRKVLSQLARRSGGVYDREELRSLGCGWVSIQAGIPDERCKHLTRELRLLHWHPLGRHFKAH